MKIKIDGWIGSYHWGDPDRPLTLFHFNIAKSTDSDYIDICAYSIEVEIETPTRDWMTAQTIKLLQEEKRRAYEEATQTAARCEDKIQKLLALTNEVKEVLDDIPF